MFLEVKLILINCIVEECCTLLDFITDLIIVHFYERIPAE